MDSRRMGTYIHASNSHFGLKPIAFSSTTCKYPTLNLQNNIPISQVESCHLKLQLEMHKIQTLLLPLNLRWSVSQLADILRLVLPTPSTSPTAYLDRRKVKLSISASQTHKYTNTQTHHLSLPDDISGRAKRNNNSRMSSL